MEDIRTTRNDNYQDRLIVAGAGGGSSTDVTKIRNIVYYGGFGGGEEGGSVVGQAITDGIDYGVLFANGGNQTHPGDSYIKQNDISKYENSAGSFGVGGKCAGGGWYCVAGSGVYFVLHMCLSPVNLLAEMPCFQEKLGMKQATLVMMQ